MYEVHDKVVLITGAGGNLGAAAATVFDEAGARLVLVDRAEDPLARCADAVRAANGRHAAFGGVDLADAESIGRIVNDAVARFGRIDALFHTVGAFQGGKPIADDDWSSWEFLMNVNVRTAMMTCKAVLPEMIAQRSGSVVTVASRNAFAAPAGYGAYSAAKSALLRMTESLSEEVRQHSISVNCIVPGALKPAAGADTNAKYVDPVAVASVALFLVSDAARAITGAALPIYGVN